MAEADLFHGIAVVIDDEINDPKSDIHTIREEIKKAGCPVVAVDAIPDMARLSGYRGASFFVVDWNMYGASLKDASGVPLTQPTEQLRKENAARVIGLLQELKRIRFAPVFLFTQESVEEVKAELSKDPDLYDPKETSHIFVLSKIDVLQKGVFIVLSEYLSKNPSAYVLKRWEREYERAKNALFMDFYGKSVLWPVILWRNFRDDGLNPSVELGDLIGRNLLSRMTPFDFDLQSFDEALKDVAADADNYGHMTRKVVEGGCFMPADQLHPNSIASGDVFKCGRRYYINMRPDCDCIARGEQEQDSVELYLLRGCRIPEHGLKVDYHEKYGTIRERDNEATLFPIYGGIGVSFQFKNLYIKPWSECKDNRIGRLLPPFLTRLQQRYSAYLQRPGLTRIPKEAIKAVQGREESPAPTDTPAGGAAAQIGEPHAPEHPTAPQPGGTAEGSCQSGGPTDSNTTETGGTTENNHAKPA